MNQENKLYRISQLLARFKEQVNILNSNGEFSINIHAENMLISILNNIYDCNLENVNYSENKTYPSIDLRDLKNKIAFQVTCTASMDKIRYTLKKFIENDLYKEYNKLYIFIIKDKHNKYDLTKLSNIIDVKMAFDKTNILDRSDIYKELNRLNNINKINTVLNLLEMQFTDNKKELDKWNIYCKGLYEYDNYIKKYYQYLDIKGFSPKINNTVIKIDLEKVFIPVELMIEDGAKNITLEDIEENKKLIFSIEEILLNFKNIVILGDPGSGKTTLLKHLSYAICSNRPSQNRFTELVPIIIKGSEYAKFFSNTGKNLSEYIIDHLDKKFELLFSQKLESDNLLVLIDGIDEINIISLRHSVINKINEFISHYPNCKLIVSSRIVGYKETRLNGYFYHFEVMKFNEDQIYKFINNWYSAIANHSDKDMKKAKATSLTLFNSIKQNKSVLTLASNPLLVTIIILVHYQGGVLPERRGSLYEIATATFLDNWVKQRDVQRNTSFDKETLITILAPISYYIHENCTTGLIEENDLKDLLLKEYKKIFPFQNPKETKNDLIDLINFLREDAGFLFEKGINDNGEPMFGFVHQTFQEYFTAIEFKTRWKEGFYKKGFEKYVFNPNWTEVIKLTASLFKINEQSRLGRQYTTDFIKDLLNVKDPLPELYRPLRIILSILNEDTEIDFKLFENIVDKVLSVINKNSSNIYERELGNLIYNFENIMNTRTYQRYLFDKVLPLLHQDNTKINTFLIELLMKSSFVEFVFNELINILKSNNIKLKTLLFECNIIYPISYIVCSDQYRNEIVKYINSEFFVKRFTGYMPTQYYNTFASSRLYNKDTFGSDRFVFFPSETNSKECMQSIKLINNEKMRLDYINYLVFSIGINQINKLKEFVKVLMHEYPDIKIPKITNYISELEKFSSYNLNEYETFEFNNTKIYCKKDENERFAFLKNNEVKLFSFPFVNTDLKKYFLNETDEYLKFLNIAIPTILNSDNVLLVNNFDSLLLIIKYQYTIHWSTNFKYDNIFKFVLSNLFSCSKSRFKVMFNWLKRHRTSSFNKYNLGDDLNLQKLVNEIVSSNIEVEYKLFLLNFIGEKSDYDRFINPTILKLKNTKSLKKKNEIKNILYEIL